MKREILDIMKIDQCCPGHDDFPNDTYKNNRSKKARNRDIKVEHRYARRIKSQLLIKELHKGFND
jgi:hypothetical protein